MDYHEDYYHALLSGIFVGPGGYIVHSNKEQGLADPILTRVTSVIEERSISKLKSQTKSRRWNLIAAMH